MEISKGDKDSNTPLHIAARSGFGSLVSLLLDAGAPIEVLNKARQDVRAVALDTSIGSLLGEQ